MSCEHCHGPTDVHGESIAPEMLAWALETSDRWEGRYRGLQEDFNRLEEELIQLRNARIAEVHDVH